MKNLTRFLCAVLAVILCLAFVACDNTEINTDDTTAAGETTAAGDETTAADDETTAGDEPEEPTVIDLDELLPEDDEDVDEYTIESRKIYKTVLGEYYTEYLKAKEETNLSKKFAMMAQAEAKLMEAAVMLPTNTRGGNYAISRVVPYSITPVLWGNDSDRFHQALVVKGDPITSEDRDALKALYKEKKGSGTYYEEAKKYLTDKGYEFKDTYTLTYSSDPKTWDALATSRAADSEAIVNTYDGLVEYDVENVMQPALAESWTVSEDGLTYTFKLRQGAKWTDSQGREIGEVKADDFVAGLQHMLDAGGGLEYLIEGVIVNASEYLNGEETDFSKVGVKALDDYTLEYKLEAPTSYFMTMLGYNCFAPMNRAFFESKGGKFGEEYDAKATTYGTTKDDIAYCGPYVVTNATEKNTIVFELSDSYWNKDNINVKTITWTYNDGSDATKAYKDMVAETIDGCGLNASALELAKKDGNFDKYSYTSSTDATSFMGFYNLNRKAYANVNDGAAPSAFTDEMKAATDAALLNVHFRRAISASFDRATYNAQSVGEELKLVSLRNCYTPGTFVALEEDVTIDINGTETTFKAGTYYGAIMQAQMDADGVKYKVWDAEADGGIGSSDGFDGWYNADYAKAELETAIAELKEAGIEISKENPIHLNFPYYSASETFTNRANAFKQSLESTLDGLVILDLIACETSDDWYYAGYYTDYGYEANYSMYDVSGWGPDYGDPATYLDTFLPEFAGYMIKCIGIY